MKKFTLIFLFAITFTTVYAAPKITISGSRDVCSQEVETYSWSWKSCFLCHWGTTPGSLVFSVSGAGNRIESVDVDRGSTLTPGSDGKIRIGLSTGGSVIQSLSGDLNIHWESPGTIKIETSITRRRAFLEVDIIDSPGSLTVGGPHTAYTGRYSSYIALARPFGNTLSNVSWTVSPTYGFSSYNPNPREIVLNFSRTGSYSIRVRATMTSDCGQTASRIYTRYITVEDSDNIYYMPKDQEEEASNISILEHEIAPSFDDRIEPLNARSDLNKIGRISPNPVDVGTPVSLHFSDIGQYENLQRKVELLSSTGQVLQTSLSNDVRLEFNTTNLTTGVYYVRISSNGVLLESQKLLVIR